MVSNRLLWQAAQRATERKRLTAFQAQYRRDPLAFVHDCLAFPLGEAPTSYQEHILAELPVRGRVAVRGPHGIGKTALAAWVTLWALLTAEDVKVPTTASAWRQLTKYLWPEIHKWAGRLRWGRIGRQAFDERRELLTLSLKLGATREAFALASDNSALIEGAHAERLVYVFDEAKTIPDATWDAAEGAFSGAGADTGSEAFALAISTPGEPQGRFYQIHARASGFEDWWTRHVKLEEAIEAGRVSQEWAEQRRRQWGEGSAVYQNRVLGEFASSEEEGVIPLAWVEAANERWRDWADVGKVPVDRGKVPVDGGKELPDALMDAVGVDVARYGEDQTVLALRWGWTITDLRVHSKEDTMATTGRVKGVLDRHGGEAVVDVIGIGAGVVDRLREQGCAVRAFNAGERTEMHDHSGELGFVNKRSAAWWNLRELLDPTTGEAVALPPDDLLTGDLTAPHWRAMSGGRIAVESKDEIKKRLGRSTNHGDAVIMAFWDEGGGPLLLWGGDE